MALNHKEEKLFMYLETHDALIKVAELVEARLVECGWRDQVRMICRKLLNEATERQTIDNLVNEITPQARAIVPDSVKKELLHELEQVLVHEDKNGSPMDTSS